MHDVLELHNGFVTDMLATYRPSKLAKYIAKASRFIAMMGPPAHEEARGTRRLDGGACFDSYGEEWMCVMQSCSCDRAIDMSEAGGSQSGPDISTACDDTSEYMTYACDVSMQQTECKIDNDLDCVTDDDWVLNWFKGGLPANASYSYSFDVEYGPDGDDTLPSKEIEIAEGGMNDDWDDWEGPQDCGGSTAERSWSMQCCGKSTCQYADAACEADPMQCAPFRTNFMYETTLNDGVGVGDETTMPPSPFPTYDSCAGYGLGDNVGQESMNSLSGQNPAESYLGNSVHEWDDVIQDDTTNCPNFDVQEFGADALRWPALG